MRTWLRRYGIRPRKAWGQSFLVDPAIAERMVDSWNLSPGTGVLEIGAGAGALTLPLIARGATVIAVERDGRLCELLRERIAAEAPEGDARVVEADILAFDPSPVLTGAQRWILAGNLPYAITTPILEWAIGHREHFAWAAFMVQREVGDRLLAEPGTKAYGSFTVWMDYHVEVRRELSVGARCFWPIPKVDSVVLRLTTRARPPVDVPGAPALERVVRAAFSHRRKVLGGSLARGLGLERAAVDQVLREAGIDPRCRAEECSITEFAALTRALVAEAMLKGGGPWQRKG